MKNQIPKSIVKYFGIVTLSVIAFSCTDPKRDDPKTIAEDHNDAKFDDTHEKDAQFLVDAATINLSEIELSKLAEARATENDVKDLAKMMVADHTKSLEELKKIAGKKMVTLPLVLTNDGLNDYNKLKEKSNTDFDKKYCTMMTDGHKDAIKKFEDIANESSDMEIKDWANKTLPTLRMHLDHAMTCEEKYK